MERGRVLRRPHFLSNANTALQFLASKKIKLVNINPADLVDGRPPVVLGLIWTIILYFQVSKTNSASRLKYIIAAWSDYNAIKVCIYILLRPLSWKTFSTKDSASTTIVIHFHKNCLKITRVHQTLNEFVVTMIEVVKLEKQTKLQRRFLKN